MKNKLFSILIIPIFGIGLVACNVNSTSTSEKSAFSVQEWIQVGDYDIFVHKIISEDEVIDGKHLVFIEVEYANNRSAEELSCRRNQWYLYDEQGYSYEAESNRGLYEDKDLQYLGGERFLNQNTKLRGWLVFEIPESAVINRIQFMTAFLGTETADIFIDETNQ